MRYGHFDTARSEYVVDRPDVPVPWTNYLGAKDLCVVLDHTAGGYSYFRSPQYGRITRFRPNNVPTVGPGHFVYLRDGADGDVWSASWQPVGKPFLPAGEGDLDEGVPADGPAGRWRTRHGLGYSVFESAYRGILASQTVFVPVEDDVEVWDVRVTNTTSAPRDLTVAGYCEFSFHNVEIDNQNLQMSLYSQGSSYADGIIEEDAYYEPWTFHYFASPQPPSSFDSLREDFLGPYRSERNPIAVERGHGSGSQGTTLNHVGALFHELHLEPGETARIVYLLGYGPADTAGRAMRAKYASDAAVDAEFARLGGHWRAKQDRLRISTPDAGMDAMINAWTLLQAETCVVWSRFASFVEVGGRVGLGYRDTAQDCLGVLHSNPGKSRQRLVELLRAQTEAGYGLHLFDPAAFDPDAPRRPDVPSPTVVPTPAGADLIHGLADTCSDDHLWLVPSVVGYVEETGDVAFLDQVIPFAEGSTEVDGRPATVAEHLRRALAFTARQVGGNGVALGLRADWNDCLNLGGGQSALVTFLHAWAIQAFLELARHQGWEDDVARWEAELGRLGDVADRVLWDGRWWRRGFTAEGRVIGSAESDEGRIFLEHQAWPVIAGLTSQERGEQSLDAVHELLASEFGMHLNWPAFTRVDDSIGFVTRVYPGIKENASIFSHPNAWPIVAEALLGRGDRAVELYDAICPYFQNDRIEVRNAEPYAYCQFVYGRDHERHGLAQNPWLTGSAGWMYTAATRYVLGVRPGFDGLVVDPSIPRDWEGFHVRREWRGGRYEIEVRNPDRVSRGVARVSVDGEEIDPVAAPALEGAAPHDLALLPIAEEGATVTVQITLG